MKTFEQFINENKNAYTELDDLRVFNLIQKDTGLKEYFVALLGDRKMFVSELKNVAKENNISVSDFNSIFLKFYDKHSIFKESDE